MSSLVSVGFTNDLESLLSDFVGSNEIVLPARHAGHVALVLGPLAGRDFREAIEQLFISCRIRDVHQTQPGFSPRAMPAVVRRSNWIEVDINQRAPRLPHVKLPRGLIEADAVIGATDLRGTRSKRPVIALGLWAALASPVHRIGSIITGQREGLTAEIGLAVSPAALIVVDRLAGAGPLVALVSKDPTALELVSMAFWQLRQPIEIDFPGPWEDPLIQRATELELGVTQPSDIRLRNVFLPGLSDFGRKTAGTSLGLVRQRLGIEQPEGEPFADSSKSDP